MTDLEWAEKLQRRIDRLSSRQRAARIKKLSRRDPLLSEAIEYLALAKNVSVLRAKELLRELLADGTLVAKGKRDGSAPYETIPSAVFRQSH